MFDFVLTKIKALCVAHVSENRITDIIYMKNYVYV